MAQKRTGLGRGIGALIPQAPPSGERPVDVFFPTAAQGEALVAVPGATLAQIAPSAIRANPQQPRREFRAEELEELIHSVREFGVLQPIVVRPLDKPDGPIRFELIMGERRLRASIAAGLATIPAVVRETADDAMLRDALLENLHRANLNALEEASAYQQLLSDFGITQDELATRLGRSRPQVTNTLRLLRLPLDVQTKVAAGVISAGHARALLSLPDETAMSRLATKIVSQSLTVRQVEQEAGLAKTAKPGAKKVRKGNRSEQLDEIAERMGDRLNTRVAINLSTKKGTLAIDFATVADLNRILAELGEPGFQ
ncbi:MAG: chromosome partitioning protein ParB [Microbacteriaceae bacterium BACL25 MAG-120322-bin65]|jgi:ParB family transcriptional regulator, chromosome partitioning protein|nr:MAG: chromosome partitioning protein ParB [Microbacteriaceae bacterium BACL25 MAG-120322-bin65]